MSILSEILSSRSRAEVFSLLFDGRERELYVREMERLSGLSVMTIKQELKNLSHLDLLRLRRSGNRHYYKANKEHQLYVDIVSIVSKTTGIIPNLKSVLNDARIQFAFIFGSFARGKENSASDIDLFIVGNLKMRDLSHLLSGCQERFDREINPHIATNAEFEKKSKEANSFISRVLLSEKIIIKGAKHEFEKIYG